MAKTDPNQLPEPYRYLDHETGPIALLHAISLYGVYEVPGAKDSPTILAWADEVGFEKVYRHDATAWCGLFMMVCSKRAGFPFNPKGNGLYALNWRSAGVAREGVGLLGDLGIWERRDRAGKLIGGHVGFIIGDDGTNYHVLGGNQSDRVSIVKKPMKGCMARHYAWRKAQPANVRRVRLAASGAPISTKET